MTITITLIRGIVTLLARNRFFILPEEEKVENPTEYTVVNREAWLSILAQRKNFRFDAILGDDVDNGAVTGRRVTLGRRDKSVLDDHKCFFASDGCLDGALDILLTNLVVQQ